MILEPQLWDFLLIGGAAFVAVYSLVRLMQVYRERLIFETRILLEKRSKPEVDPDADDESEDEETESESEAA